MFRHQSMKVGLVLSNDDHRKVIAFVSLLIKVDKRANKRNNKALPRSNGAKEGQAKSKSKKGPHDLSYVTKQFMAIKDKSKALVIIPSCFILKRNLAIISS